MASDPGRASGSELHARGWPQSPEGRGNTAPRKASPGFSTNPSSDGNKDATTSDGSGLIAEGGSRVAGNREGMAGPPGFHNRPGGPGPGRWKQGSEGSAAMQGGSLSRGRGSDRGGALAAGGGVLPGRNPSQGSLDVNGPGANGRSSNSAESAGSILGTPGLRDGQGQQRMERRTGAVIDGENVGEAGGQNNSHGRVAESHGKRHGSSGPQKQELRNHQTGRVEHFAAEGNAHEDARPNANGSTENERGTAHGLDERQGMQQGRRGGRDRRSERRNRPDASGGNSRSGAPVRLSEEQRESGSGGGLRLTGWEEGSDTSASGMSQVATTSTVHKASDPSAKVEEVSDARPTGWGDGEERAVLPPVATRPPPGGSDSGSSVSPAFWQKRRGGRGGRQQGGQQNVSGGGERRNPRGDVRKQGEQGIETPGAGFGGQAGGVPGATGWTDNGGGAAAEASVGGARAATTGGMRGEGARRQTSPPEDVQSEASPDVTGWTENMGEKVGGASVRSTPTGGGRGSGERRQTLPPQDIRKQTQAGGEGLQSQSAAQVGRTGWEEEPAGGASAEASSDGSTGGRRGGRRPGKQMLPPQDVRKEAAVRNGPPVLNHGVRNEVRAQEVPSFLSQDAPSLSNQDGLSGWTEQSGDALSGTSPDSVSDSKSKPKGRGGQSDSRRQLPMPPQDIGRDSAQAVPPREARGARAAQRKPAQDVREESAQPASPRNVKDGLPQPPPFQDVRRGSTQEGRIQPAVSTGQAPGQEARTPLGGPVLRTPVGQAKLPVQDIRARGPQTGPSVHGQDRAPPANHTPLQNAAPKGDGRAAPSDRQPGSGAISTREPTPRVTWEEPIGGPGNGDPSASVAALLPSPQPKPLEVRTGLPGTVRGESAPLLPNPQPTGWTNPPESVESAHSHQAAPRGGILGAKPPSRASGRSSDGSGQISDGSTPRHRPKGGRSERAKESRSQGGGESQAFNRQESSRGSSADGTLLSSGGVPTASVGSSVSCSVSSLGGSGSFARGPIASVGGSDSSAKSSAASAGGPSTGGGAQSQMETGGGQPNPPRAWQGNSPARSPAKAKQGVVPARGSGKGAPGGVERVGPFVPYLPQDDVEGGLAVEMSSEELSKLLKLGAQEFWKHVARDDSLPQFLNSYLRFRKRPHDVEGDPPGLVRSIADEAAAVLQKRVFLTLYRLSSPREPGAGPGQALSPREHTELLRKKDLLGVPQLMDVAAIYGATQQDLTRRLVETVFENQPGHQAAVAACVEPILNTLSSMRARSAAAVAALGAQQPANQDVPRVRHDLNEVIDYVSDVAATLGAFVGVCPAIATALLPKEGEEPSPKGTLLSALATAHDRLLPTVLWGLRSLPAGADVSPDVSLASAALQASEQRRARQARARAAALAWALLEARFFAGGGPGKAGGGPPRSESGSVLVEALVSTGGGEDEDADSDAGRRGALLRTLDRKKDLRGVLRRLQASGKINIDTAQLVSIDALLGPLESKRSAKQDTTTGASAAADTASAEEEALQRSKISQIKDLLPDYGDGFLAVCLDAYDNDAEQVIAHLLDGNLSPELAALDTRLAEKPRPQPEPKLGVKDKGKAKVVEERVETGEVSSRGQGFKGGFGEAGPSGSSAAGASSSVPGASSSVPGASSSVPGASSSVPGASSSVPGASSSVPGASSSAPGASEAKRSSADQTGRYVRRDRAPSDAVKLLDARGKGDERLQKMAREYEYEDEYDDSFDELTTFGTDAGDEEGLDAAVAKVRGGAAVAPTGWGEQKEAVPPPQKRGPGPPGARKGGPQFYVKDGKNYSYKVAGSVAVESIEAAAAMKVEQEALIHGLGAGGNVPNVNTRESEESGSEEDGNGESGEPGPGVRGRGGGRRGGGGGGGRGSYARKEQNKSSVANHRRKDRATAKFVKAVGGF